MKTIKVIILIVCCALFSLVMRNVSADEVVLPIDGGVYHMITSPVLPGNPDPQVNLVDNLGPYDETQWRLFRYEPERGSYDELKSPDWDPIKDDFYFGRGYWIISLNDAEINIVGEPIGEAVEKLIILEHEGDGWNQIGNIFDYDFPIISLYVARTDDPDPWSNKVQLIDLVNNDLTYVTLQEFENGNYVDIPAIGKTSLEARKAYWLKVEDNVDVDVILWFVVRGPSTLSNEIYLSDEFLERFAQQDDPPDPPPAVESTSSGSSSSGSGSGGCFIATAAYRDYDHPKVQILREFRDQYLLSNSLGRIFVGIYYRYSPTLAKFILNRDSVKALIRCTLMPIVGISAIVSKMDVYGFFIVLAFPILMGFFLLMESGGGGGRCKAKFSIKSEEGKRKR
jgi:hypothetical protein